MRPLQAPRVLALLLSVVVGLTGCPGRRGATNTTAPAPGPGEKKGDQTNGKGGSDDTPEAVFAAMVVAGKKGDTKARYACFTPKAQKDMVGMLAFGALNQQSSAQRNEERRKKYKPILDVLDKHGLNYEVTKKIKLDLSPKGQAKGSREVAALIKDPGAFAADLDAAYAKTEDFKHRKKGEPPDMKLIDVKTDGDKAKGSIVYTINGKEIKEPIEFVRIDGRWKIAPDSKP